MPSLSTDSREGTSMDKIVNYLYAGLRATNVPGLEPTTYYVWWDYTQADPADTEEGLVKVRSSQRIGSIIRIASDSVESSIWRSEPSEGSALAVYSIRDAIAHIKTRWEQREGVDWPWTTQEGARMASPY